MGMTAAAAMAREEKGLAEEAAMGAAKVTARVEAAMVAAAAGVGLAEARVAVARVAVARAAAVTAEAVAEVLPYADEPKSATLATYESESSTSPGLRSRWSTLLKCRYAKLLATSLAIERSEARHVRHSLYTAPPCISSSSEILSSSRTMLTRCTWSVAMPSMSTTLIVTLIVDAGGEAAVVAREESRGCRCGSVGGRRERARSSSSTSAVARSSSSMGMSSEGDAGLT